MTKHALRAIAAILMIGGLFAGGAMSDGAATLAAELRRAFALPFVFVWRVAKSSDFVSQINRLGFENQSLLAELQLVESGIPRDDRRLIRAKIFASYPFNDKHTVTISKGAADGVRVGMAVLFAPGIFFGEVRKADMDWSEVSTIFDPSGSCRARGRFRHSGLLKTVQYRCVHAG